jgi:hypothetical protein
MWLAGVLIAVALSPPFVDATATAVPGGDGIEVSVTVEVRAAPPPSFVVMHVLLAEEQETYSLAIAEDGTYVGTMQLAAVDRAVLFEAGWDSGAYSLSEVTSLVALGVPLELVGDTFDIETLDRNGTTAWAWVAVAATASAVAALILFFMLPKAPGRAEAGHES